MYAADTHTRLASLRARSSAISQLVDAGAYVWLAATDGGVSIYTRSGALQDTLAAHSAKVTGIAAVEKHVWTCGADMTIRVWQNDPPFTCRKVRASVQYTCVFFFVLFAVM
jgi:sugar lactone lactonase YvrE